MPFTDVVPKREVTLKSRHSSQMHLNNSNNKMSQLQTCLYNSTHAYINENRLLLEFFFFSFPFVIELVLLFPFGILFITYSFFLHFICVKFFVFFPWYTLLLCDSDASDSIRVEDMCIIQRYKKKEREKDDKDLAHLHR